MAGRPPTISDEGDGVALSVTDFGRRSYDGGDIALLIGQLQASVTSGFSSLNARLDMHSNQLKEHDKHIRQLQDKEMREEGAAELLRKMADDARARAEEAKTRGDRNFKVLSAMIALLGIPGVLAFASRFL